MTPKEIKKLIASGQIITFTDLVNRIGEKEIAKAMGCGPKQVRAIQKDSSVMTLGQLFGLSEWLGMERWKVAGLFCE